MVRAGAEIKACLAPDERDGQIRARGGAEDRATVCVQPGRNVHGQQRTTAAIHRLDHLGGHAIDDSRKTGAEQRVDDDIGPLQRMRLPRRAAATGRDKVIECVSRIATLVCGLAERNGRDIQALRARDARQHIAVAAIIARSAKHGGRARARPGRPQCIQCRVTCARHQLVAPHAELLDRAAVERANLGGGIDAGGEWVHRPIILGRPAFSGPPIAHGHDRTCRVDQALGP
jgi:hypothetical protein